MQYKTYVRIAALTLLSLATTVTTMAQSTFGGGSGSQSDPYLISQPAHLEQLAAEVNAGNSYLNMYFKMTNDLDFGGGSHTPIGCEGDSQWNDFQGTFDGGGYQILNVKIEGDSYVGIFGRVHRCTIKNLTLGGNSVVEGKNRTGGFVGRGMAMNLYNCHVTKDVKINATGWQTSVGIGGIIGEIEGGRYLLNDCFIRNCTNAAPISFKGRAGAQYMGGIIGYARSEMGTTIENCYNVGAISPIGYGGTASNCRFIGGIVGWHEAGEGTLFKNCYCGGDCTLPAKGIDGSLKGVNVSGETMRMSRVSFAWDINGSISTPPTSSLDGNDYFASGTKVDMTLQYTGELATGLTRSYTTTTGTLRPNGTGYTLTIGNQDAMIRLRTSLTYRDIGYTPWVSVSTPSQVYTGEPLTPAPVVTDSKEGTPQVLTEGQHYNVLLPDGGCTHPGHYTIIIKGIGPYDGQQASTFTITSPQGTWAGNGTQSSPYQIMTLDDLKLLAEHVNQGNNYHGVHFRMMNDIDNDNEKYTPIGTLGNPFQGTFDGSGYTINNWYIDGINQTLDCSGVFGRIGTNGKVRFLKVSGKGRFRENQYVGAIAGRNDGEITMCENGVAITDDGATSNYIGGIAGYMGPTGTISYCTNDAAVQGMYLLGNSRYIGGIVGYNERGTVETCFNHKLVLGQEYAGGIAGYNVGTVSGCINNYLVQTMGKYGGIVGENAAGGVVSDCLSLSAVYDNNSVDYRGSIIGRNLGTASNNYYNFDNDTNTNGDKNLGGINGQDVAGQAMRGWKITASDDLYFDLFPDDNNNSAGYTYDGVRYLGAGQSSNIMMTRGTEFSNYTLQVSAGSLTAVAGRDDMYRLTMPAVGQNVHISVGGDLTLNLLNDDSDDWYHNTRRIEFNEGFTGKVCLEGRTLYKNGQWNTLCLPFDVTLSGSVLDGAEARTLSGVSFTGQTLTLSFSDAVTTLQAGIPYIIRWNGGSNLVSPVFDNVTINNTLGEVEHTNDDGYEVAFRGNYNTHSFTQEDRSILYLGSNNTLYYPQSGIKIGGLRACFQLIGITAGDKTSQASHFVLDFEDATTGISEVRSAPSSGAWFSLDGRQLSGRPTARGIYVNNGKKVMIK